MSDTFPTPEQLSRFLAGESPASEEETVRRWLAGRVDRQVDVDAALRRVKDRGTIDRPFTPRFVALAAAAVVIMIAGAVVAKRGAAPAGGRADGLTTYNTTVGQRDSVALADGSRIVLGPATSLVISREREVELRGEAYFDVVHNSEKPFIVRAAGSTVTDLGTVFTVSSDAAAALRVVVSEGVVAITHASDSVTLQPGDVGLVAHGGQVMAQRGAATPDDLAWLHGRLVFRDANLAEVAADLRRWYGVELRVTDSALVSRHFTGEFAGDPLDRVLEVLGLALSAQVERRGDTAFVSSPASLK
jgi:transmembrane sensor